MYLLERKATSAMKYVRILVHSSISLLLASNVNGQIAITAAYFNHSPIASLEVYSKDDISKFVIYLNGGFYFDVNAWEAKSNQMLFAYPNPASNSFSIIGLKEQATYYLVNSNGSIVQIGLVSDDNPQVNIETLMSGLYTQVIEGAKTQSVVKVAKY